MLVNIIGQVGFNRTGIAVLILYAFCILLALMLHEVAHGFAAYKLGDPTAKQEGRLTLNPLDHLDPVGTLMMVLFGFGWAKPVPINPRRLRKPKRDIALVALAGPLANLLIALVSGLLQVLLVALCPACYVLDSTQPLMMLLFVVQYTLGVLTSLNVGLALFNLIPLPPLDGSNILLAFLKPNAAAKYLQIRLYVQYIMLGIVALNVLASYSTVFAILDGLLWMPFTVLRNWILQGIYQLGLLIFGWI